MVAECWRWRWGRITQPVALSRATVIDPSGHARFTVLTDSLLRMEFSASGAFEDRATTVIRNRQLPVPAFNVSFDNHTLTLTTKRVRLTHSVSQPFSPSTLSVRAMHCDDDGDTPAWTWTPGMPNTGNLLGTYSSLDELGSDRPPPYDRLSLNCSLVQMQTMQVREESLHCADGLVSQR
jgi:hypothetical protein